MPEIGEIRKGREIGGVSPRNYIWVACPNCNEKRWVRSVKDKPVYERCQSCASKKTIFTLRLKKGLMGSNSPGWKGGRVVRAKGYILIHLQPDDFFYSMTQKSGYVFEHRLVVAKALGRCLHGWEIVHHKHSKYPAGSIEDKQDNRYPENLQLIQEMQHMQITKLELKITQLQKENKELKRRLKGKTYRDFIKKE